MSDVPERVTPGEALKALQYVVDKHSDVHRKDVTLLAQFIAERAVATAPRENTGLPCPVCDEKLPSLSIRKINENLYDVLIARRLDLSELKSLVKLLKGMLTG